MSWNTAVIRRIGAWVALISWLVCPGLVMADEDSSGADPPLPAEAETPPVTGPAPLSVTISGGGTKGAYMAGQLYYLQEVLRLGDGSFEPRVYTGASAGAINSVTALLGQCGREARSPRDSVFWSVWIPVGLNELFRPDITDEPGLFSRKGFDPAIDALRAAWDAGLPTTCDVLIGVAITRLEPRIVELAPGFPSLPRSLETVVVRVTGRGAGRAPLLRNYVDPAETVPQVILPLDGEKARPFDSLRDLVYASAAFPVGFVPVDLAHCMSKPGKAPRCTPGDARREQFIDGGVFANQPLGLSVRAMRGVVRSPTGALAIADAPTTAFLPEAKFLYVDPRVSNLPTGPAAAEAPKVEGALGVVSKMLGMAESVQSAELLNVFEREPSIRSRLVMSNRRFPHVSSTFTGLLERSFREFDFYLGMYDAAHKARSGGMGAGIRLPEQVYLRDRDPSVVEGWRPFTCLRALFDGAGDPKRACSGEELRDFRILARVTLDRLRDICRTTKAAHGDCRQATWSKAVPSVRALPDAERERRANESELDYLLRLLARYRFHFRDLGLERDDAEDVQFRLARLAQEIAAHLAASQPTNAMPLGVLARVGVDVGVGYVPPQHIFHMSLGLGAELGYSVGIDDPSWSWLRFTTALELDGFSSLLNSDDNYLALRPKLGVEFEVLAGSYVQLRLGARGGYQFSTGDSFMREDCDFAAEDEVPCSRVMTEAYVSSSLLGLIRLHIAGVYMPPMYDAQTTRFGIRPMVGIQLNSPF